MPQGLTNIFNAYGQNDNRRFLYKLRRPHSLCSINEHTPSALWVIFFFVIKNRWQNKVKHHKAMNKLLRAMSAPAWDSMQVPPFPRVQVESLWKLTHWVIYSENHISSVLHRQCRSQKSDCRFRYLYRNYMNKYQKHFVHTSFRLHILNAAQQVSLFCMIINFDHKIL